METHIQKWGNSLGIRIPNYLAKQLELKSGSAVSIHVEKDQLIIKSQKYHLDTMLNEVNPENLHYLNLEDDEQIGNEAW